MSKSKKKVAALQLASGSNVSANLLETERDLAKAAAKQGAELIVLPELRLHGAQLRRRQRLRRRPGTARCSLSCRSSPAAWGVWVVGSTIPLRGRSCGEVAGGVHRFMTIAANRSTL